MNLKDDNDDDDTYMYVKCLMCVAWCLHAFLHFFNRERSHLIIKNVITGYSVNGFMRNLMDLKYSTKL